MKKSVLIILLYFIVSGNASAQDPLKVGPNIYKSLFENERGRVLEVTFEPGESIDVHQHPDHFVYVISAGKLRINVKNGETADYDLKEGEATFIPAQFHSATNIGNTKVKVIVIEIKKEDFVAPEMNKQ